MEHKYAAVAVLFGNTADRYVIQGYTEPRTFDQMLADAQKVDGLTGIEVIGGWHINDDNQTEVVQKIQHAGFDLACVIPEIWANPKWGWGTFASTDPGIRRDAIDRVKVAMDLAASTGCNHVSPWFGHDGWDYIFQMDYLKAYDWIIEGLSECADHNPNVNISVEFKPKEPRTHILVANTAKTLLLINEVNKPNVGVNLDVGHANMAYETLAECVALLKRFGDKLMHLHLNDNYRYWDDDMIPGSVHTLEWIEFFYWLNKTGYDNWYSLDVFAYREKDKVAAARESIAWLEALSKASQRLDHDEVTDVLHSGDAMKAQAMVRKALFG
ncbi:MAG: hypothetical protein CSA11_02500 [Chloroflexi bacterium]|nr:MAG: hypothetical protein CSB13_04535 [Chloroflexota bacterium]PIE82003.1 MAG: hypothetical protein CSA11_02500 [Chloroflexota bacterium]